MGIFLIIIGAILLVYVIFTLGYFAGEAQRYRLELENRQLRRMLNDLRRVDEINFQAFSAMAHESVKSVPRPKEP